MKNLKKMLAMSLVFAMILTSMSALFMVSAYDDVTTSDANLFEAVSVLSDIGIVKGKDATNFGAADNIKRSEAAAILVRMLGKESAAEASKGKTDYTDVAADHWASGYINVASGAKIINGDGDGTFRPDDNVTYEQFLKMVVVALGYDDVAKAKGGWATGYLIVANDLGLAKGVKVNGPAPATRGDIAKIAYLTINTPLREQTKFGSDPEFTVYDGGDDPLRTMLTKYLNIKRFRAEIVSNGRSALEGTLSKGKIGYRITDDFDLADDDYPVKELAPLAKIGTSKAADYLGYRAVVYIGQDDTYNEDYVVSIVADTARVTELKISSAKYMDLDKTEDEGFANKQTLYYWIDLIGDKKQSEAKIDDDAVMLVNGVKIGTDMDVSAALFLSTLQGLDTSNGSVKLVNNDSNIDDYYDYIYVTTYLQGVVDEIDTDNQTLTLKEGDIDTLSFDKDDFPDSDFTYTLKDKNGADVDFKSIAVNDVIAVAFSDNVGGMTDSDYMDVVVLKDKVTGTIIEKNPDTDEFKIEGKLYEASNSNTIELGLDDNGTFYLDIDGKIIFKTKNPDGTGTISSNYAYLIDVGTTGGIDSNYQVQVFNKDGQVKTLNLSASVRVNFNKDYYASFTSTGTGGKSKANLYDFLNAYINETDLTATDVYDINDNIAAAIDNLVALRAINTNDKIASRIVDLNVSSDGLITRITFPNVVIADGAVSITRDTENYMLSADAITTQYKSSNKSFANRYSLTDSTKVFYVPENSMNTADDIELRSITSFTEDKDYHVGLFDLNSDNEIGLVVLSKDDGFSAYDSRLALIDRLGTTIDTEGNELDVITMIVDGKSVSKTVSSKGIKAYQLGTKAPLDGTDISTTLDLAVGDAIQYTENGTGYINSIAKIFDFSSKTLYDDNTAQNTGDDEDRIPVNEDAEYVFAKVYKGGSALEIEPAPISTKLNKASTGLCYAEFDETLQRTSKSSIITSSGIKAYKTTEKYYVLARMFAGQAMDIIQYRFVADVPDANIKIAKA